MFNELYFLDNPLSLAFILFAVIHTQPVRGCLNIPKCILIKGYKIECCPMMEEFNSAINCCSNNIVLNSHGHVIPNSVIPRLEQSICRFNVSFIVN